MKLKRYNKIILYSRKTCPYSKQLKEFLINSKIEFDLINVNNNEVLEQTIKRTGHAHLPIIDIKGTIINNPNIKQIKNFLKLK